MARSEVDEAAALMLDTVPLVMRALRREVRLQSGDALSIPRFHALLFIQRHPGTGLSGVSEYLGATLPATSELITRLVAAGLVNRATNDRERRRVSLTLTEAGGGELEATRREAHAALVRIVAELEPDQMRRLVQALGDLRSLFAPRAG